MQDPTSVPTGEGGPIVPLVEEPGWFDSFNNALKMAYDGASALASGGLSKINPVLDGMLDFNSKMSKIADVGYGITGREEFANFSDRVNREGVRVRESQGSINRNAERFKRRADAIKEHGSDAAAEKRKATAEKKKQTPKKKPKNSDRYSNKRRIYR